MYSDDKKRPHFYLSSDKNVLKGNILRSNLQWLYITIMKRKTIAICKALSLRLFNYRTIPLWVYPILRHCSTLLNTMLNSICWIIVLSNVIWIK